jgi:U3 small nucleolar RNA-associated protein 7
LKAEVNVDEAIHDVAWLQDETMFAAAQKSAVYIYDQSGTEIHCLRKMGSPTHLEYLPYHFLLFAACGDNYVRYQDISTGQQVAEWATKSGSAAACTQNPANAVTFTGHAGGTVNLWSPTVSSPLVKMFVHRGPVKSMSIDSSGNYLATSGTDGLLRTWDLRTFKMLDQYKLPGRAVSGLSFSQSGLLAAASGPNLTVWKDITRTHQKTPYMRHTAPSSIISSVSFCPFEDVLGIGQTGGISTIIVPGAGEANFDTLEANPFANKKQRQEAQVKQLLDKLQPETIMLDPDVIGSVSRPSTDSIFEMQSVGAAANRRPLPNKEKNKMRGKSSAQRRLARKRENIVDEAKLKAKEDAKKIQIVRNGSSQPEPAWSALDRFKSNPL